MRLTAWEEERLLIFAAAELARRHRSRGLPLNHPEAVAIIADEMLEAARAGATYDEVERAGRAAVDAADLLPGVAELVDEVRVEVLMGDGTRLIVLVEPWGPLHGDASPGAVVAEGDRPDATAGLERRRIEVRNSGRRVVRVSSHYPFHLVNSRLEFDRAAAAGYRLDLPAGADERWGPGETREITLVRLRGEAGRRP